jgi:peroxisomal membrane protein 2
MADEVKALWGQYLRNLQRHPLRTKAITAGVLAGSADMVAQKLAGARNLQFKRAFLLMLYGFCYSGPFGHYFHKFMEKLIPSARDSKTIVSKVIVEQLTSGPWNNFIFITYLGLVVEGRPWKSVKSQLKSNFPSVQLNAWRFWPIVSLINYKYLPIQLRVLFHNLAAVCWGIFLILRSKASVPKLATA